jgi:DNA-directed RNA polymerase subunit H (RpoH/RPB5)
MRHIGIDLDGTIDEMPWFFQALIRGILSNDNECFGGKSTQVHIITWRDASEEETIEDLRKLGLRKGRDYDVLHLPKISDNDPVAWKREIVVRENITLMIEDSPENLAALPENVQRLWLCNPEIYDLNVCIDAMHDDAKKKKLPTI